MPLSGTCWTQVDRLARQLSSDATRAEPQPQSVAEPATTSQAHNPTSQQASLRRELRRFTDTWKRLSPSCVAAVLMFGRRRVSPPYTKLRSIRHTNSGRYMCVICADSLGVLRSIPTLESERIAVEGVHEC